MVKNVRVSARYVLLLACGLVCSSMAYAGPLTSLTRLVITGAGIGCVYDVMYHEGRHAKEVFDTLKKRIDASSAVVKKKLVEVLRHELELDKTNEALSACMHDIEELKKQQAKR